MSADPALVAKLRAACGDEHVLTHHHQLRTYESDGLLQYAQLPSAVALPGSTTAPGTWAYCSRPSDS